MRDGTKQEMRTGSREADAIDAQDARANPGQTVSGPGFYVWEEDPRQARQWGAELAEACRWQQRGNRS